MKIKEGIKQVYKKSDILERVVPVLGLIFVIVLFSVLTQGALFDLKNLENIVDQSFLIMVMAIGAAFVIAHGALDFSIGAIVTFDSVMIAALLSNQVSSVVCILLAILIGLASGLFVGCTHVFLGIPAFLTSLAMSYILRGSAEAYTSTRSIIYVPPYLGVVLNRWEVKLVFLILVFAVGWYLFNRTTLGKHQKTIGGSETVAVLNGVNVKTCIILSHVIAALCAAMATVFSVVRVGLAQAKSGTGLELDVIVALVLGGMPLNGGEKSRISAAVIGAVTVAVLENGLTLVGIDVKSVEGITGILFIICVTASLKRKRGEVIK